MVNDHADREIGYPLLPLHALLFPLAAKYHPRDRITHTRVFATLRSIPLAGALCVLLVSIN